MRIRLFAFYALTVLAAVGLSACGDSSGSGGTSTGTASFDGTDAPVDGVQVVKVTFDGIAIKPSDGEPRTVDFDEPVTINNLLDLTGDASEPILGDTVFPAGQYDWVRLFVVGGDPDSMVREDNNDEFPLFIPGQQPQSSNSNRRFLHLATPFVIPAGGNADFTIDFELRKALTKPATNDHYLLRPALRLINNVDVGKVAGTVDDALINDVSCTSETTAEGELEGNSVYLYEGFDAAVGDVNVDNNGEPDHDSDDTDSVTPEVNPVTTAEVKQNDSGIYEYLIGFVAQGEYTVAFTCQSLDDEPETDEDIVFEGATNITVTAGETTEHDFQAP